MNKISILFLVIISLSSAKCFKFKEKEYEDETLINFKLPEKTETGANTFGFLLNSKIWTNYGQVCLLLGGCHENLIPYFPYNGGLNITADKVLKKNGSTFSSESINISIEKPQFNGVGNYNIGYKNNSGVYYRINEIAEKVYVTSDTILNFVLKINKFDTVKKIISGEFYGTLYNLKARSNAQNFLINHSDSLVIQQGRFDVMYR